MTTLPSAAVALVAASLFLIVIARAASAQSDTVCTYTSCSLSIRKAHWFSDAEVVQGECKQRLTKLGFFPATIPPLEHRADSTGRFYRSYVHRKYSSVGLIAAAIPTVIVGGLSGLASTNYGKPKRRTELIVYSGWASLVGGFVLNRSAHGQLDRAIISHNAGLPGAPERQRDE
jgi:hypothetical protein